MKDRFDYGKNPEKTQGGELIFAYMCDPETADDEFMLSKAKYKTTTGREQKKDAIFYSIRLDSHLSPAKQIRKPP